MSTSTQRAASAILDNLFDPRNRPTAENRPSNDWAEIIVTLYEIAANAYAPKRALK
jgi:hypothetical protein